MGLSVSMDYGDIMFQWTKVDWVFQTTGCFVASNYVVRLILTVVWICLQCVIEAYHTHLLFGYLSCFGVF